MILKRVGLLIFYSLMAFAIAAQDDCYTCSRDSMIQHLTYVKGNEEKVKLLTFIIDFAPNDDSANSYIQLLIDVNNQEKLIDTEPYKSIKQANEFYATKEYDKALRYYKNAVELFDKKKKKIVNLLLSFRNLFNLLNIQEERYKYYNAKLSYYLVNGPYENTAAAYHGVGGYYTFTADYNQAISYYLKGAEVFKKFYPYWYHNALGIIGIYYAEWGNLKKGLAYMNHALPILKKLQSQRPVVERTGAFYESALAQIKLKQKNYPEAVQHADIILNSFRKDTTNRFYAIGLLIKGLVYINTNEKSKAYPLLAKAKYINQTFHISRMTTYNSTLEIDYGLYQYFASIGNSRSAEKSLLHAYGKAVEEKSNVLQLAYLKELASFYMSNNNLSAGREHINKYFALKDKIDEEQSSFKVAQYENEQKQTEQLQNINALKQEKTVQEARLSKRNTILFLSLGVLLLIVASAVFLYRQLKINEKNLRFLKSTQSQLIQSEKMASLGELTAGIAHEIQNPLNFVNNFSEVSNELMAEMNAAIEKGDVEEAKSLAGDITQNLEKINLHGKRADAIVKGMLQHSRSSNGKKEPTDINALADEYLRLAYHGLRAKDKTFNATLQTDYDDTIANINIIPQDMGRVILNLITNAFYAVAEKKTLLQVGSEIYMPTVTITSKRLKEKVFISVEDNGNGMSSKVLDKIFQPFFTTKPTGEGTGLGLSLSYDIIKAHGGEIKVQSTEGKGTTFTIQLPVNH